MNLTKGLSKRFTTLKQKPTNKLKNSIKELEDYQSKEAEYDISFIPKEEIDDNLIENTDDNDKEFYELEDYKDSNSSDIEDSINKAQEVNKALHEERTLFYSTLTDSMDEEQYDHFSKCRTQNFLSKGKEAFIEWAKIK